MKPKLDPSTLPSLRQRIRRGLLVRTARAESRAELEMREPDEILKPASEEPPGPPPSGSAGT